MPKKKKYVKGGELEGKSHAEGGIPGKIKGSDQPLEFEGGEYVIKKDSVNEDTEAALDFINENGTLPYEFGGEIPTIDARKRKGKK